MVTKKNLKKYLCRDYYSIESVAGKKVVNVHGYFFTEGYEIIKGKPYRAVDYSGVYIPLEEFMHEREMIEEYLSQKESAYADLSEEEAIQQMNNYYGIKQGNVMTSVPWKALPYSELNMDTPCGCYVDVKETPERSLKKEGDRFRLSGDIAFEDYNCRVDTTGEVLMDQKEGETMLLCVLDYIDGDRNVTAYVDVKDMLVA